MAETGTDIQKAAALLRKGEVVAIPTETVYGLAGIISSEKAIRRIYEVKNRPLSDPLIVHVASAEQMRPLITELPPIAEKLLEAFSPGPLTLLLPKSQKVSSLITSYSARVALRIPAHPLCLELIRQTGEALAAPSANPFGGISPTSSAHVQTGLGKKIPYILEGGECSVGLESTLIGILPDGKIQVLRQGGIPEEDLQLFAELHQEDSFESRPVVPGSMLSHYAPVKPLLLNPSELPEGKKMFMRFQHLLPGIAPENQRILSASGDLREAAMNLFSTLHLLDASDADFLVAEKVPDLGLGRAINDRLKRASAKRTFTKS